MGFPLTLRSMTLDDLELLQYQILLEFCDISRVSQATTAKRMKIDPYCQRRNCGPLNALFSNVKVTLIFDLIAGRSPTMGIKQLWGGDKYSYTQAVARIPGVS